MLRMRGFDGPALPLGPLGPLFFLVLSTACMVFTWAGMFLMGGPWPHVQRQMWLDARLALVLVALYAIWWLLVDGFRWVGQATGAGFVLAAYGLWVRAYTDVLVGLFLASEWPPRGLPPDHLAPRAVRACYDGGLVAIFGGLALVVGACWFERRTRRRVPPWHPEA